MPPSPATPASPERDVAPLPPPHDTDHTGRRHFGQANVKRPFASTAVPAGYASRRPAFRRRSGSGRQHVPVHDLTYPEAVVIGLLQGVTELFPVSSLGHSILLPALLGGRWARDLSVSAPESPYLAFVVGLHVATAVALLVHFRKD